MLRDETNLKLEQNYTLLSRNQETLNTKQLNNYRLNVVVRNAPIIQQAVIDSFLLANLNLKFPSSFQSTKIKRGIKFNHHHAFKLH